MVLPSFSTMNWLKVNLAKHPLHPLWYARVLGTGVRQMEVDLDSRVVHAAFSGRSSHPLSHLVREILQLLPNVDELIIGDICYPRQDITLVLEMVDLG